MTEGTRTRSGRLVKPPERFTYNSMDEVVVGGEADADPEDYLCEGSSVEDDELSSSDSLNEFIADDDEDEPPKPLEEEVADMELEEDGEPEAEESTSSVDDDDDDDYDDEEGENEDEGECEDEDEDEEDDGPRLVITPATTSAPPPLPVFDWEKQAQNLASALIDQGTSEIPKPPPPSPSPF